MAELARRDPPTAVDGLVLTYRLVAPVFDHEGLVVTATPADDGGTTTTVRSHAGRLSATATFTG